MAANPVAGFPPPLQISTAVAVHGPVAIGIKGPAADNAPLILGAAHDLCMQFHISREDGGTEIFAQQGAGQQLGTGTRLEVFFQEETGTAAIIGA